VKNDALDLEVASIILLVSVVGAGDAAASPSKLVRIGQNWSDLNEIESKFGQNRSKIWVKVI